MDSSAISFLIGLLVTAIVAFGVVLYLRPHLHRILVDLCGNQERAAFWTAFSAVTLILVPMIGAMLVRPHPEDGLHVLFEINGQLRMALIGLVGATVTLAVVISTFIPRESREQRRRESGGGPSI